MPLAQPACFCTKCQDPFIRSFLQFPQRHIIQEPDNLQLPIPTPQPIPTSIPISTSTSIAPTASTQPGGSSRHCFLCRLIPETPLGSRPPSSHRGKASTAGTGLGRFDQKSFPRPWARLLALRLDGGGFGFVHATLHLLGLARSFARPLVRACVPGALDHPPSHGLDICTVAPRASLAAVRITRSPPIFGLPAWRAICPEATDDG